jgi:phosphatidylglycerophosphate synthase
MTAILHDAADTSGLVAAAVVLVTTAALLLRGLRRSAARLGPANAVTLTRTSLVAVVTGFVVRALLAGSVVPRVVVAVAAVALALDAVDGLVARATGSATALGARFDWEVDAFFLLVLSAWLARDVAVWVVAIGLLRYVFVAVGSALPWLLAPLPPRYSRKVVAAVQGVALVVAASGALPAGASVALLGAALASLVWSFGTDVVHLARTRPGRAAAPERVLAASR